MTTKFTILLFFLLLTCVSPIIGAETTYDISRFDSTNGLSSNEVFCIYEDKSKYIWIGTDNGLCRYDGNEFRIFKSNFQNPDFFISNTIRQIREDNGHNLWMITSGGLEILDNERKKVHKVGLKLVQGITIKKIYDILITSTNRIFIAADNYIIEYNQSEQEFGIVYTNKIPDSESCIRTLYESQSGIIWFATIKNGIYSLNISDNFNVQTYPYYDKIIKKPVSFLEFDKNLWVGTWNDGLFKIELNENSPTHNFKHYLGNSSEQSIITSLCHDDENIWIASLQGIALGPNQNNNLFIRYNCQTSPEVITSDDARMIICSSNKTIWVATLGGGIYKLTPHKNDFRILSISEYNNNYIYNDIYAINKIGNKMILGVKYHLLSFYDTINDKIITKSQYPELNNITYGQTVSDILLMKDGNYWITTRYGGAFLVSFTGENVSSSTRIAKDTFPQMNTNHLFCAIDDAFGNIWIGSESGLMLFNSRDKQLHYNTTAKISNITKDAIVALTIDQDGVLWAGSEKSGIYSIRYMADNPSEFTVKNYSISNSRINSNDIQCLFIDSENTMWAGTKGGAISSYNSKYDIFETTNEIEKFNTDAVFSINQDRSGYLWFATDKGLIRFDKNTSDNSLLFFNEIGHGRNASFTRNATYRDSNGVLYFGANCGLVSFDPEKISLHVTDPDIIISDISINNGKKVLLSIRNKDKIILSHKEYNISLKFSSLSFNDKKDRFAYKMDGIDDNWNYLDQGDYSVTYNLRKGKYTLSVKAIGENGIWSETPFELNITAKAAPWDTPAAYCIYVSLAIIIAGWYTINSKRQLKLQQSLEIERIERKKSEEVNQAKLKFFTNISHELFTPLTALSCSIEELTEEGINANTICSMRNSIKRQMRLLIQILEFRKAESGNLKLKVSKGNIVAFIKAICENDFRTVAGRKNISIEVHSPQDEIQCYFDTDKLDKIIYNLLSNAFKYNYEGGQVAVNIEAPEENIIKISVADTGCGIETSRLPFIFNRFYEGDYRKFNVKGTGIGLSLVKDLTTLHNGTVTVCSEKGKGSVFTITLPVSKDSYTSDQIEEQITDELFYNDPEKGNVNNEETEDCTTILIVEDNPEMLNILYSFFMKKFRVIKSKNGKDALLKLRNNHIDIILTDYVMPEMNGMDFCRIIKEDINTSHIPVIILTAKRDFSDKLKGYESGADLYITKPFELSELMINITSLLSNRKRIAESYRKHYETTEDENNSYSNIDKSFLNKATDIIINNISESDFSSEQFCKLLNMSQTTLYRKLKSLTGLSANEFIRNIRIKKACELLLEYDKNISEVAYLVGFNNPKYFSNIFKKETGLSPSEYIKSKQ